MNDVIERLFANSRFPLAFLYYDGAADTYVVYRHTDNSNVLGADNRLLGWVDYFDFDIFSKTNYMWVLESLITVLTDAGFVLQPSRCSADMYEKDTKLYHKTLCFARERGLTNG